MGDSIILETKAFPNVDNSRAGWRCRTYETMRGVDCKVKEFQATEHTCIVSISVRHQSLCVCGVCAFTRAPSTCVTLFGVLGRQAGA